jgi:hypothetical protein
MPSLRKLSWTASLVALLLLGTFARAEMANQTPEQLARVATHVFTAEVREVYKVEKPVNDESRNNGVDVHYLFELMVDGVEKGEALPRRGEVIYVRTYSVKVLTDERDPMNIPEGGSGARGLPQPAARTRVHVTRVAGGAYELVLPNGFIALDDKK